jgi:hypothetical protein
MSGSPERPHRPKPVGSLLRVLESVAYTAVFAWDMWLWWRGSVRADRDGSGDKEPNRNSAQAWIGYLRPAPHQVRTGEDARRDT